MASTAAGRSMAAASGAIDHSAGIQLFTMQSALAKDFKGTLDTLARIGYRRVETLGLLGYDPKEFRKALDNAGLSVPSLHIVSEAAEALFLGMAQGIIPPEIAWQKIVDSMNLSGIEQMMNYMLTQSEVFGNQYLVLAAVDGTVFDSDSGLDMVIAAYTKAGEMCHQRGVKFAFHPHLSEFRKVNGKRPVDAILLATDPAKVFVELDYFWAAMADTDIPAFLERYSGRFRLGHVKDIAKDFVVPAGGFREISEIPPEAFADIGYGRMDYRKLIALGRKAGIELFFVERDVAPDPINNAKRSYGNLKSML
jgi:sugar phosphate isomerase/epimerase